MKIIELEEVDSTNEYCKRINRAEDIIVIARKQTAGKGTKGRSFSSEDGGLYVSAMRKFENFSSCRAFEIMINSCVAVCETLKKFGIDPVIRWANDVLVNGKKICGTLIENTFSGQNISRSIVGVGINVNNKLPDELSDIATTMCKERGKKLSVGEVCKSLIENLQRQYSVEDYKSYINWFGKDITLKTAEGETYATAIDVDGNGKLVCRINGIIKQISSAEVSLRI